MGFGTPRTTVMGFGTVLFCVRVLIEEENRQWMAFSQYFTDLCLDRFFSCTYSVFDFIFPLFFRFLAVRYRLSRPPRQLLSAR